MTEVWMPLGLFVSVIVWGLRLEGKQNSAKETSDLRSENIALRMNKYEAEQEDLRRKLEALNDKILDKLLAIEKQLSRFEGRLLINEQRPAGQ